MKKLIISVFIKQHCLALLVITFASLSVVAHPISLSSAAVNVKKNKILANIKILLEDLVLYNGLKLDVENHCFTYSDLNNAAKKHSDFLLKYFTICDKDGNLVPGNILGINSKDIPVNGAKQSELMARNVFYQFEYSLTETPDFITFTQTFGGNESVLPAVMELVLFQDGQRFAPPLQLIKGKPHSVKFDWANFNSKPINNWDDYYKKRKKNAEQQLGITSYSGLYSFIYITNYEVRHEILIPLLTLEKWVKITRENEDFLDVSEQENAKETITAFFKDRNPVIVDGITVKPVVSKLQFFGLDINDFAKDVEPRRVSTYQARIGIILSYTTKGSPSSVKMIWDTFSDFAPFLQSIVFIQDNEAKINYFKEGDHEFIWNNESNPSSKEIISTPLPKFSKTWSLPIFSLIALIGTIACSCDTFHKRKSVSIKNRSVIMASLLAIGIFSFPFFHVSIKPPFTQTIEINKVEADNLILAVLRNIYRAFDYNDESDVYDVLANSVDGRLLDELFIQIQNGLYMQKEGGAIANVKEVKLIDNQIMPTSQSGSRDFQLHLKCRWQVTGIVEHWGHIHTRKNEYEAKFILSALPSAWKITEYDILNDKLLSLETGLRTLKENI